VPWSVLLAVQAVQGLLLAPALNFVPCFGEEWGWRGYLLPKMAEKFSAVPLVVITGVIWGLWHAPVTALGHNYGVGYPGFPWAGIAAMCGFCIVLGIFFSYLTIKTGSCIPAVLAHGAVNGTCALGIYLTRDGGNPFVGPAPTGIVGAVPFLVLAAVCLLRLKKQESAGAEEG
jgi:membrane protease YdiL (CAAX protease family)